MAQKKTNVSKKIETPEQKIEIETPETKVVKSDKKIKVIIRLLKVTKGRVYRPGEVIELSENEADKLLKLGEIEKC